MWNKMKKTKTNKQQQISGWLSLKLETRNYIFNVRKADSSFPPLHVLSATLEGLASDTKISFRVHLQRWVI